MDARDKPGHDGKSENVDHRDIGAKHSFVASPGDDDKRMLGENFVGWISESVIHRHNTVGYGFG